MAEEKAPLEILSNVEGKYIMYKDKPLVREGNMICYGFVEDKYTLQLTIMNNKVVNGVEVPDKVIIQIINNDNSLSSRERIKKQDMKSGLYDAFELGLIWLERYNNEA